MADQCVAVFEHLRPGYAIGVERLERAPLIGERWLVVRRRREYEAGVRAQPFQQDSGGHWQRLRAEFDGTRVAERATENIRKRQREVLCEAGTATVARDINPVGVQVVRP